MTSNPQFWIQIITFLLPIIGLVLPGFFKQDGLSDRANGIIALVVVAIVSAAQAFFAGQLGVNPYLDFGVVAAGITSLLVGPLKPLDQYIQSNAGLTSSPPPELTVRPRVQSWQPTTHTEAVDKNAQQKD